jgi:hypothetical protein
MCTRYCGRVSGRPAKQLLEHGWLYVPAVSSPIGGGLIKLGRGSTWAAVAVGVAPYAVCVLLYLVFVLGYLAAVMRYLCAGPDGQEAMERLITVSANAVVSILTLRTFAGGMPRTGLSSRRLPH